MMLYRRLAAILVVMALLGVNTAAASICEAYCAGSGQGETEQHHHGEMRFSSPHHHSYVQAASVDCPECVNGVAGSPLHSPRCGMLAEVQPLQEYARTSFADCGALQLNATLPFNVFWRGPVEAEGFLPFQSPPKISTFQPILVSIRI